MSILVTGGLGYIGSHTVNALIEAGYSVVVADNLSNSKAQVLDVLQQITNKNIPFYQIDVTDEQAVNDLFEKHPIEGVMHFAGYKAVGESVLQPLKYYQNNVLSTITLANACKQFQVKKFVFSSSATVYGDNEVPFKETMSLLPTTNPYGETKAMGERILKDWVNSDSSFAVSLLRYFNPIGAHPSGLLGESPNGIPNNLMPYVTQVAKGKLKELQVFGNDYPTSDGTGVRDYIHVMDLAEGHVAALQHVTPGVHIYNLGTGAGTSVFEIIQTFERVNAIKIPYKIVNRRPGDLAFYYADATKAKDELGWYAKRTLEDMCRDAWHFEKSLNLIQIK
ncbi:UDP-glucose 4-epimerase GalE [Lysinibacillus sp. KU-BSD001]|uniref:UDP-glucose 4-epimerase GalE n=1 Tax=Lysinibacillus sp. KU-BSD001 TaxID=3141328 RepID=UPI0036E9B82A